MEKSASEKLLVIESDDALRKMVVDVLIDAGYQVSVDYRDGMRSVLAFSPDAVILGAYPPQLDCCDLLCAERSQNIRVLMLSRGGPAERTRGMDLGADDVLSLPFDSHELLWFRSWLCRSRASAAGTLGVGAKRGGKDLWNSKKCLAFWLVVGKEAIQKRASRP